MNAVGIALALSLCAILAAPVVAVADDGADRACARLLEVVQSRRWMTGDRRGDYVCEVQDDVDVRFVFALRWRGEGLPAMGSNLVGYYLVDAASGDIHAWDLGDGRRGEALVAVPTAATRASDDPGIEPGPVPAHGECKPDIPHADRKP
jgi:hypothetical protein